MSISFEISQSAKDTLQDITVGLNTLLAEVHKKYKDVYNCCGSLADLIFLDLAETSDIETAKAENKDFLGFCNFLARASVLAYLQKLDNDKDIDKLRESGLNIDFKFGYTGLVDKVLDCVEVLSGSESSESHVNGCVETGLLASVREIEPNEYKTSGKMSDDIIFVAELGNKTREDLNLSIKDFIKRNEIYNKYYEDTVDEVLAIYKYFLQDSFGLRPYEGVLSFNSPYFMLINNENTVGTQKDANRFHKDCK